MSMQIINVDFETFYDKAFSLSKMTTEEYIRDELFEVIGVAVKVDDGETQWFSGTKKKTSEWLDQFPWDNSVAIAHNAMFDMAILNWHFDIRPKRIADTLSMARAIDGPDAGNSLAKLAERHGLGVKGNEVVNALGKGRLDFTPEELARYGEYCINDVELTSQLFRKLAVGFPLVELRLIDLTIRMFTEPVLELDKGMLAMHLFGVREKKEKLLAAARATGKQGVLMSNPQLAELLSRLGVDAPKKISATTGKETWAFGKTDEGFKALLDHSHPAVQAIVAARLGVKSTLEETRTERFIGMGGRGRLAIPLRYAGARTYRWSGSDSVNLQNIPRKSKIKQAIRAPEGYTIVGADLSNIELRVGLWLAGQMDKLRALGEGRDLYKDFASIVFGVPYDEVTDDQRFIGKTSQLSLIYGVGAKKLRAAIKSGSKVDIGEAESQRIVDLYRQEYAHVKAAWDHGERALTAVQQNRQMPYGRRGLVQVLGAGGVLLPSELILRYPKLCRVTEEGKTHWVYTTRKGREFIYGAKFFQGVVQSLARCVIGESMIRIDRRYPTLLTIHDADYVLALDNDVEAAKAFVYTEMCKAPKWMSDIPLNATVKSGKTLAEC